MQSYEVSIALAPHLGETAHYRGGGHHQTVVHGSAVYSVVLLLHLLEVSVSSGWIFWLVAVVEFTLFLALGVGQVFIESSCIEARMAFGSNYPPYEYIENNGYHQGNDVYRLVPRPLHKPPWDEITHRMDGNSSLQQANCSPRKRKTVIWVERGPSEQIDSIQEELNCNTN